jgi:hypothetical protein
LFADWADEALLGLCCVSDFSPVALYSRQKIYDALRNRGMCQDDVEEYYASLKNLRAGEFTPVIFDDLKE